MSPFQTLASVLTNFASYVLYMAMFNVLYGFPDEIYEAGRISSMKPWKPLFEEAADIRNDV